MNDGNRSLDELLAEADATPLTGWDFSFLRGRVDEEPLPWDFAGLVRSYLTTPVLDMGTGGGEFFSRFAPFSGLAVATEAWPPNVRTAGRRLLPLGVSVVEVEAAPDNNDWQGADGSLPFADGAFALVINRHEAYSPTEVFRVLRPSGMFVTQQVGQQNDRELKRLFAAQALSPGKNVLGNQLRAAGFAILTEREALPRKRFLDVGAVAWYIKAVPWDFPGFAVGSAREFLARVHAIIEREQGLVVRNHRRLLVARKP